MAKDLEKKDKAIEDAEVDALKSKQIFAGILLVCLCAAVLRIIPLAVASEGGIGDEREVTLTVQYAHEGAPVSNALFTLYEVASAGENDRFLVTAPFARYPIATEGLSQAAWSELATTLAGYVYRDGIEPTAEGRTDENGVLCFAGGLQPGLYLLLGEKCVMEEQLYTVSPTIVALPGRDPQTGMWIYDVTVEPKYQTQPVEPETVTRKVLKIWDDKGDASHRPAEIEVQLLRDGELYETVKLSEENGWRYTWEGLRADCEWLVVEKEVEGYHTRTEQKGITFTITNTRPSTPPDEPPTEPELPHTGQLWWPVPVLLIAGPIFLLAGIIRYIRYRRDKYEEKK